MPKCPPLSGELYGGKDSSKYTDSEFSQCTVVAVRFRRFDAVLVVFVFDI